MARKSFRESMSGPRILVGVICLWLALGVVRHLVGLDA